MVDTLKQVVPTVWDMETGQIRGQVTIVQGQSDLLFWVMSQVTIGQGQSDHLFRVMSQVWATN